MREYHVVEVKKRGMFSGPLDAPKLTALLNEHAANGWIFDRAIGSETLMMGKDTFLLVFHRPREGSA